VQELRRELGRVQARQGRVAQSLQRARVQLEGAPLERGAVEQRRIQARGQVRARARRIALVVEREPEPPAQEGVGRFRIALPAQQRLAILDLLHARAAPVALDPLRQELGHGVQLALVLQPQAAVEESLLAAGQQELERRRPVVRQREALAELQRQALGPRGRRERQGNEDAQGERGTQAGSGHGKSSPIGRRGVAARHVATTSAHIRAGNAAADARFQRIPRPGERRAPAARAL
jgi:hypothetical protein